MANKKLSTIAVVREIYDWVATLEERSRGVEAWQERIDKSICGLSDNLANYCTQTTEVRVKLDDHLKADHPNSRKIYFVGGGMGAVVAAVIEFFRVFATHFSK